MDISSMTLEVTAEVWSGSDKATAFPVGLDVECKRVWFEQERWVVINKDDGGCE